MEVTLPCDTRRLPNQTLTERKVEIREAVSKLSAALVAGRIKPVIGPQGALAFQGWLDADRGRVTDSCAYRLMLSTGSALALQAIAKAELLAGRKIDRQVIGQGAHSHDNGKTWHHHKG
jgi:hypothetical protein